MQARWGPFDEIDEFAGAAQKELIRLSEIRSLVRGEGDAVRLPLPVAEEVLTSALAFYALLGLDADSGDADRISEWASYRDDLKTSLVRILQRFKWREGS